MTAFQKIHRRQFIKMALTGAGSLGLARCASIESAFQSDKRDFEKEVVIVGGGLAGFAAAYTLKKNKIPFRLYEAEKRLGGRVWSETFGSTNEIIELGAEYFTKSHLHLFQLMKELDLTYEEIGVDPKPETPVFKLGQRIYTLAELRNERGNFFNLINQIKLDLQAAALRSDLNFEESKMLDLALYYDKLSIHELIEKYGEGIGLTFRSYLDCIFENKYGVTSRQICCLAFVKSYSDGNELLGFNEKGYCYKVSKGNGNLIGAIHSRIKSIIPDHVVKKEYRLQSISFRDSFFNLRFETRQGVRFINAKIVVLALPLPSFSEIYGFSNLKLNAEKLAMIKKQKYISQTKIFWGLKERSSRLGLLSRYPLIGQSPNQISRLIPGDLSSNGDMVLQTQRKGEPSASFDLKASTQELEVFDKNIRSHLNSEVRYVNWAHQRGIGGSFIYTPPGDYFSAPAALAGSECNGQLFFAGEHTSLNFRNTMEGAIQSGFRAAREAIEGLKKNSEKRTV